MIIQIIILFKRMRINSLPLIDIFPNILIIYNIVGLIIFKTVNFWQSWSIVYHNSEENVQDDGVRVIAWEC